jgi:hypothetical protein
MPRASDLTSAIRKSVKRYSATAPGGEQPKFCTIAGTGDTGRHVLVKCSPAGDAPTDLRSRDLQPTWNRPYTMA